MKHRSVKTGKLKRAGFGTTSKAAIAVGVGIAVLALFSWFNNQGIRPASTDSASATTSDALAGKFAFQVGIPGPGQEAPPIRLVSNDGSTFDLTNLRGKTVLLYFQEGVTCQPCWDQIKDVEHGFQAFRALGIDTVVTVAIDPIDLLKQKAADSVLLAPVLSDPGAVVSKAYHANDYGMMGKSRDGHTFIVVGPDGRIRWRADYGGAPNYTMYLPVQNLVADIRQGLAKAN